MGPPFSYPALAGTSDASGGFSRRVNVAKGSFPMNIFYIIGVIVVILAILSFLGLR